MSNALFSRSSPHIGAQNTVQEKFAKHWRCDRTLLHCLLAPLSEPRSTVTRCLTTQRFERYPRTQHHSCCRAQGGCHRAAGDGSRGEEAQPEEAPHPARAASDRYTGDVRGACGPRCRLPPVPPPCRHHWCAPLTLLPLRSVRFTLLCHTPAILEAGTVWSSLPGDCSVAMGRLHRPAAHPVLAPPSRALWPTPCR